ncbi:Hypothetical predicted protein [Marmota monax]|nr:Hypothetical predicted protein [Marmota monax]
MLTFNRARKFLGLSHCEQFFNIGLGLPTATLDFFLSLNIPIFEVYGLSEGTGIHTLSSHQAFRLPRWVLARTWMHLGLVQFPSMAVTPASLPSKEHMSRST